MSKGYLVLDIEVVNAEAYECYRALASHLPAKYGGRLIIGKGKTLALEGDWAPTSLFIMEFPSFERAKTFYQSAEYQRALPLRLAAAISKGFLIDGVAEG